MLELTKVSINGGENGCREGLLDGCDHGVLDGLEMGWVDG
jgi:hypothetical protein